MLSFDDTAMFYATLSLRHMPRAAYARCLMVVVFHTTPRPRADVFHAYAVDGLLPHHADAYDERTPDIRALIVA